MANFGAYLPVVLMIETDMFHTIRFVVLATLVLAPLVSAAPILQIKSQHKDEQSDLLKIEQKDGYEIVSTSSLASLGYFDDSMSLALTGWIRSGLFSKDGAVIKQHFGEDFDQMSMLVKAAFVNLPESKGMWFPLASVRSAAEGKTVAMYAGVMTRGRFLKFKEVPVLFIEATDTKVKVASKATMEAAPYKELQAKLPFYLPLLQQAKESMSVGFGKEKRKTLAELEAGLEGDFSPVTKRRKTSGEWAAIIDEQGLQGYVSEKLLEYEKIADEGEKFQKIQGLLFDFSIYKQGIRPTGKIKIFGPLPGGQDGAWYTLYGLLQNLLVKDILKVTPDPVAITARGGYRADSVESALWSLFADKGESPTCDGKPYPKLLTAVQPRYVILEDDPGPDTPHSLFIKGEVHVVLPDVEYKVVIIKGVGENETWVGTLALKFDDDKWVVTDDLYRSSIFMRLYMLSSPVWGMRDTAKSDKDSVGKFKKNIPEFEGKFGDFFGRVRVVW